MAKIDKPWYCGIPGAKYLSNTCKQDPKFTVADVLKDLKQPKISSLFLKLLKGEIKSIEADYYEDVALRDKSDYVKVVQEALLLIPGLVSQQDKKAIVKNPGAYGAKEMGGVTSVYVDKLGGADKGKKMDEQFTVILFKILLELKKNPKADWKNIYKNLSENPANYEKAKKEVIDFLNKH